MIELLIGWPLLVVWKLGPLRVILFLVTGATFMATGDAYNKGDYVATAAGLALGIALVFQFLPLRRRRAILIATLAFLAGLMSPRLRAWVLSWKAPAP